VRQKIFKKLAHRPHHLSHAVDVHTGVDNLGSNGRSPAACYTTRANSTAA